MSAPRAAGVWRRSAAVENCSGAFSTRRTGAVTGALGDVAHWAIVELRDVAQLN